ncbi:MAG: hypothetical protein SGILL_002966 [Bacillariaceae sp.]
MMNPPVYYSSSDNNMGYSFAQPAPQATGTSQEQVVPHYGNEQYHKYQVPASYNPEYTSYASSTVAASNPPDLLDSAASSYDSSYMNQQPSSNTADDVLAVFEQPTAVTAPAPAQDNDAFLRSFTSEEIAEQQRLMADIEKRKSSIVTQSAPPVGGDMTVYQHQERLWNSMHQSGNGSQMVPHTSSATGNTRDLTTYDYTTHQEHQLVTVPRSHNPSGSDAVHPRRKEMKQARKIKQATAATGGAIVGGVLFGPAWPIGVVAGGAVGAVAGKQISKAGERRAQRKWEKQTFRQYAASESAVVKGEHDML